MADDRSSNPSLQDILDAAGAFLTGLAVLFAGTQRDLIDRIGRRVADATGEMAERIAVAYRNLVPLTRRMVVRSFFVLLVLHVIIMAWVGGVFDGDQAPHTVSESFWFWWIAPVGVCLLGMIGLFLYAFGAQEIPSEDRRTAGSLARMDRALFRETYGPSRAPLVMLVGLFSLVLGLSVADFAAYINLANANGFYTMFVPAIFVALFALAVGVYAFLLVMVFLVPLGFVIERGGGFMARVMNLLIQTTVAAALTGVYSDNVKDKLGDLNLDLVGVGQGVRKATDLPVMGLAILALFAVTLPSFYVAGALSVLLVASALWNSQRAKKGIDTAEEERRNLNALHNFWKWTFGIAIAFVLFMFVFTNETIGLGALWTKMQCYTWAKLSWLALFAGVAFSLFVYLAAKLRKVQLIAIPFAAIAVGLGIFVAMTALTVVFKTMDERPSWAVVKCAVAPTYTVRAPSPQITSPSPAYDRTPSRPAADRRSEDDSNFKRVTHAARPADCPPWLVAEACARNFPHR